MTVVQELIRHYLDVENLFQQISYDKNVQTVRETYKDNVDAVLETLLSHLQLQKKNRLMVLIIKHLQSDEPGRWCGVLRCCENFLFINQMCKAS